MPPRLQPDHDLDASELAAVEQRLDSYNRTLTGRHDDRPITFTLRDEAGEIVGLASGYSWAGIAELKVMWVDESCRGLGCGKNLLDAFIAEAASRGAQRVWVSTHDFQAPEFYETAGFRRAAELADWPEGHSNIILCKTIESTGAG